MVYTSAARRNNTNDSLECRDSSLSLGGGLENNPAPVTLQPLTAKKKEEKIRQKNTEMIM
jgi:hypothetical protein